MSLNFFNGWPKQLKILYGILGLLAFAAFAFFIYYYIFGTESAIMWNQVAFFEQVPFLFDEFKSGPFSVSVKTENLLILQNFEASPIMANSSLMIYFLLFTSIGLIILLTVSTYLPRFWFFSAMAIWIIVLSVLRMEMLGFGNVHLPLMVIGGLTVLTAFYFNAINNKVSLIRRLLAFVIIFTIFSLILEWFSFYETPFLLLASNALIPMLLLTIFFALIIAHEIVALFLNIITSNSERNNHIHFVILTFVYLLNLILLFLHHTGRIEWDAWFLNPFLLLVISVVAGIWGFRQREQQYQHIISFIPLGAYFYLSLAIISFATIGFLLGSVNDPGLRVVEDGIIYGHLAYGFLFLLYILSNFSTPLSRGMKVKDFLYRPMQMPYFMFRFAGFVGVIALVIIAGWQVPHFYTIGAYFNQQGDLAQVQQEELLKQSYYHQAHVYAYKNHHANYNLAHHFKKRKEMGKASVYYLNTIERTPSPYAYINLARIYHRGNRYFESLFALQKGASFLENGQIYNNLGLLYSETDIIDSAIYYLEKANRFDDSKIVAAANIEALAAIHDLGVFMDSLELEEKKDDLITLNNKIVRFNQQQKFFGPPPHGVIYGDSANFFAAGMAYNYLLNTIFKKDTSGINEIVRSTERYYSSIYSENVRFAQAGSEYYNHKVQDAFRRLNLLAGESFTDGGKYYATLGKWALEQENPNQAAEFFKLAKMKGAENVVWLEALSLLQLQNPESALQVLNQAPEDSLQGLVVRQMATAKPEGSDRDKLFYVQYHITSSDTIIFNRILNSIKDENIKAEAILSFSKRLFNLGMVEKSVEIYGRMTNLQLNSKFLYNDILKFELRLLAARGNFRDIATQINNQNLTFTYEEFPEKVFYAGLLNAVSNETDKALANFRWLATNQPFMEMEVVMAAKYIKSHSEDKYEAYNLLLNALELNPSSIWLIKAYAIEAKSLNLDNYAENALEDLQKLVSIGHYQDFLEEFNSIPSE